MTQKKKDTPDLITRRGFVSHAAAAGGGGVLAHMVGGRAEALHAEPVAPPDSGAAPASSSAQAPIPRRPFGNTGAEIPIVGLGAGSRFYGSTPDDESAAELIRAAIDRGIAFVETGSNYGPDGVSEKRIGLAMKTHREGVFLETKVDERDYDGAMREMERSLQRMNTDHLDLVLHHNVPNVEAVAEIGAPGGAEKAIRAMIEQGVVGFRGLSTHTPAVAMAGMERLDPQAIQLPINAVRVPDFEAEVIPRATEAGHCRHRHEDLRERILLPGQRHDARPNRAVRAAPGSMGPVGPAHLERLHPLCPVPTHLHGHHRHRLLLHPGGVAAAASSFEPLPPTGWPPFTKGPRSSPPRDTGFPGTNRRGE